MEILKYVCPIMLFVFSILAVFYAVIILFSEDRKDTENKLMSLFCLSSAIWSLGFGALLLQTDTEWAYWCRVFGMIGTILYLITGQMLVSYLSGIKKIWANIFNAFAGLGIFVYFLTVERSQTIYQLEEGGMTYSFKSGPANTIYTVYSLVLAVLMFGIALYMCFSKVKRVRFFGKIFIMADMAMLLGTILDTVFPLLGFKAIPGSTVMQFFGMLVVYLAIRANNRSKINIANMSEFIYYSLSMPVLVYNAGKKLQIANEAAAKFFEINQNAIRQQDMGLGTFFELEDDTVFDFEGTVNNKDLVCIQNGVPCNLAINKIQDHYNDTIGYIIIVTDLSERVKNLQRLEEAKAEAEAANRSKTLFLANMSHEIRTPMNAILGFSELILKKDTSEVVDEYATDIKKSCLNLLAVINDILDISKLDSGRAELSNSNYFTASLLQEVHHIIDMQARKKGLHFEMNTDPRIPNELYGDKTRMRGILINLLNNAVKYTEQGSVVFHVRLLGINNNCATLEYTITDTGIGIKEESLQHLFDSFARFDAGRNTNVEGTGLGLSIVKGYVTLMGGTIKVDSIYGRGSTFTVTLEQEIVDDAPLNFTRTTAQDGNAMSGEEMKIRDTRVLVTDDNQINLKVIKSTLEYYGLTVETADSGSKALEMCQKTGYDMVFMDQMMPEMDGVETMQKIRGLSSHYAPGGNGKIIVLTANAIVGVRQELMEKGFDEYLSKPLQLRELEQVLKQFVPGDKLEVQDTDKESNGKFAISENISKDVIVVLEDLLPQINVTSGLEHCQKNVSLYLDILHMIHDDAGTQLGDLKALWEEKKYSRFIVQIHSIKTQLLNIGYVLLAEEARALELAGKENRFEYISDYLEVFADSYRELAQQLEKVFLAVSKIKK